MKRDTFASVKNINPLKMCKNIILESINIDIMTSL